MSERKERPVQETYSRLSNFIETYSHLSGTILVFRGSLWVERSKKTTHTEVACKFWQRGFAKRFWVWQKVSSSWPQGSSSLPVTRLVGDVVAEKSSSAILQPVVPSTFTETLALLISGVGCCHVLGETLLSTGDITSQVVTPTLPRCHGASVEVVHTPVSDRHLRPIEDGPKAGQYRQKTDTQNQLSRRGTPGPT